MSDLVKVPLDQATRPQLFHYIRSVLNLDIGEGANNAQIKAKILQAQPGATEILVPQEMATAPTQSEPKILQGGGTIDAATIAANTASVPASQMTSHPRHDPKVELVVMPSADPTRPKDVQVAVQGETILIKRGERVKIPYRYYIALEQAVETVPRDTDTINPTTGLPFKEWVEQHSYPFQVYAMPSAEEIAAWEARLGAVALA